MEGKVTGESLRHEQAHNRNQKLQHNPNVSSTSSIRPVFESAPSSVPNATDDPDMMRGIRSDLVSLARVQW